MAPVKARRRAGLASVLTLLQLACAGAFAGGDWLESGDVILRNDLLLLNDAGVIRTPVTHWPVPVESVRYALENAKEHFATNSAVSTALLRVRERVNPPPRGVRFAATARAGHAALLRDFDSLAREDGELTAGMRYETGRFAASLNITGVADPDDGQEVRADGSHLTMALGNWLVSAHTLDRWWGPGHESSLILSNNARPMPTLMVERAQPRPFATPWLSWLGPWRFSFGFSQMEEQRLDVESPLFMAWRVAIMPFGKLEIGFSRTAQFCGEGLPCDLQTFGNLIAGNDNVGFDATEENEPGNQMAGFDMRWNSPIGNWPYAIYGQMIGEDESSYLPAKYLAQFGFETWKPFPDGSLLQTFVEYSDTTCSAVSGSGPYFDCAYNQGLFDIEGYRYRGRVIGHTTDRDARSLALGATYARLDGDLWSATLRSSEFNRDNLPDNFNTMSPGPADYAAFEMGWRGHAWGGNLSVELGVEALRPLGQEREIDPYGFVSWRHDLEP
jgi:hypothetical protein